MCGVCVSIYVRMEFEGEERKKGEGHTTYCHCWEFKDYMCTIQQWGERRGEVESSARVCSGWSVWSV